MREQKKPGAAAIGPGQVHQKETPENGNYHSTKRRDCQTKRRRMRMDQERDQMSAAKPGYWAVLPADVRYDPGLPPMARLLYAEISSLTDQTGFCYASNAYFLRVFELSERTLQRHLRVLETHGYLRIEDGDGGHGRRRIFTGINPLNANPVKNDGVTPSKMTGGPDKNVAHNKIINNTENRSPQSPPGGGADIWDPEAFERFWKLYPKKRDKAKAIKEWNRLKADRKLMRTMSAALGRQMASEEWQRDNGRAIPYPCRWLSHRRWEDELTVSIQTPAADQREEDRPEWI